MPSRELPTLHPRIGKRLDPAPVRQAICQIKHEELAVDPYAYGAALQDELGYDDMQPHSMQEFILQPTEGGFRPSTSEQRGIILRSVGWTVNLFPNSFSLDCSSYERWEQFLERFKVLLEVVLRQGNPRLVSRVGVRFIDELVPPRGESMAREYRVDPNMAGILQHPRLGPRISAATSMAQLQEGRYNVLLRHGFDPALGPNYMVDTDCFLDAGFAMRQDTTLEHVEALHDLASRVFRESISDEYYEAIGGEISEGG